MTRRLRAAASGVCFSGLSPLMALEPQADPFAAPRQQMVESQLRARCIGDERVLAAIARVPRHLFVGEAYREQAYTDRPLPIAERQTISQPYIVGVILQALALQSSHVVLEIGSGSGYMTALLAELAGEVYAIERYEVLARQAEATLAGLGYSNAISLVADGTLGLPEHAPFDAIAVSAAAPGIPPPLFDQLREGGRMVVPVGPAEGQTLELVRKSQGRALITSLGGCTFVPLVGSHGYVEKE
jgi:protein-L-isoaspartate(D-aspartate) O-methyltransferase